MKYKQTAHSLEHMIPDEMLFNLILEDAGLQRTYTDSQGDGRTIYVTKEKPRNMRECFIEWEKAE